MATFVDENSHILSNEVQSSSSLVSALDKEKISNNNNNDNHIVNSIFTTPINNAISKDDSNIDNNNNNNNNDNNNLEQQQQQEQESEQKQEEEKEEEKEEEETLEQKQRREIEESERLAWELMQQEEQQFYQQQVDYMRQNSETISAEDLAAIQQIVNEPSAIHFQQNNEEGDNEDGNEEGDEDEDDASENWDYDQLIALGQAIGDVKTERWRLRAKNVIDSLPVIDYDEILKNSSSNTVSVNNSSNDNKDDQCSDDQLSFKKIRIDHSCTVCMDNFEKTDKLNLLPCSHYFHTTCLKGWLADHNNCPICKRKVTCSP